MGRDLGGSPHQDLAGAELVFLSRIHPLADGSNLEALLRDPAQFRAGDVRIDFRNWRGFPNAAPRVRGDYRQMF